LIECLFSSNQAVNLAVKATERFLNDLRRDLGDDNFNRLFTIDPSEVQCQNELDSVNGEKRFRFFTPVLSSNLKDDGRIFTKFRNMFKKLFRLIESILTGRYFREKNMSQPSYDLSDKGVNVKNMSEYRLHH
jgi:hypothetical protein